MSEELIGTGAVPFALACRNQTLLYNEGHKLLAVGTAPLDRGCQSVAMQSTKYTSTPKHLTSPFWKYHITLSRSDFLNHSLRS